MLRSYLIPSVFVGAFLLCLSASANDFTNDNNTNRNLVIVTIDGLRWQEVFAGADISLINNHDFTKMPERTKAKFWNEETQLRTQLLMPFVNGVIAEKGVLVGDRNRQSYMSVNNEQLFSYPGYNEIFTGVADPSITTNTKGANTNVTFLEWLNNKPAFKNKVAIFSGWDVFREIYNQQRSKLIINAGFDAFTPINMTDKMATLNQLQEQIPSPWHNVRHDAFTYGFAKEYLNSAKPRVMVINLGETDDFAHNGNYGAYLESARRNDWMLQDLWQTLQSMRFYTNNTNLLVITDHGRGSSAKDWQHHASAKAIQNYMKNLKDFPNGIGGAQHIWFAAIGPDIAPQGVKVTSEELKQDQFAATALALLGIDIIEYNPQAAASISGILK